MKGAKKKSRGLAGVYGALRALGAFRFGSSELDEVLEFEFTATKSRAAIPLHDTMGTPYEVIFARGIHVLFSPSDIARVWNEDVWSVEDGEDGECLKPTRHVKKVGIKSYWTSTGHAECFTRRGASPVAIVLDYRFFKNLENYDTVFRFAESKGIPVIKITEVKAFLKQRRYSVGTR